MDADGITCIRRKNMLKTELHLQPRALWLLGSFQQHVSPLTRCRQLFDTNSDRARPCPMAPSTTRLCASTSSPTKAAGPVKGRRPSPA